MGKHSKQVQALSIFLILCVIKSKDEVTAVSLWGKKVDFMQNNCSYWELKKEHKFPTLKALSVCVNIKKKLGNSDWTAFMYLHPDKTHTELGMRGYGSELHVTMFGRVWITPQDLSLHNWHSICMTWSKAMTKPKVYLNGTEVVLYPQSKDVALHPNCCTVAAGGTLTLAVAHFFVNDKFDIETGTDLKGSISLFRVWGHVRSAQEISEMACYDGDVLHWEERIWKKVKNCQPLQDVTQECDWPFYEVKLVLLILREDGNKTHDYDAKEVAHQLLTQALAELELWPTYIYLNSVRVFPKGGSHSGNPEKRSITLWSTMPGLSQFDCVAHINVIPRADVGKIQEEVSKVLAKDREIDHYRISTDPGFIFVYPLDHLLPDPETKPTIKVPTSFPPTTQTTPSTTPEPMTTTITAKTESTTAIQLETTTVISSSTETTIPSSPPFIQTTLAESSSTFKETTLLSSTTTIALNTTACFSTALPEGNKSDIFFKVNVNVTIKGPGEPKNIIQLWLNETLSSKGISVLNFKLIPPSTHKRKRSVDTNAFMVDRKSPLHSGTRHSCVFHARVTTSSNITETQILIHRLLEKTYCSGFICLDAKPEDILISYIVPCPEHNHYTRQGLFRWPQTVAEHKISHPCEGNPSKTAYRQCYLDADSNSALWTSPNLGQCQVVVHSVSDLEDITVTNDNAEDILIMIEDLIHEKKHLDESELSTVLNKLADVINVSTITPPLGEVIINITSDILQSDSNLLPFTNSILNITESVGDQMLGFKGESVSLTAPALAISVVNIDQGNFQNLTFGVSSTNKGFNPEIYINQEPFDGTVAFISLPSEIQERFPIINDSSPRIQFQFYGVPALFQTKDDPDGKKLNTFVVSASVTNATGPIENLKEYVAVTLHHLQTKTKDQNVHCVYWDFNKNDGYGGWSPKGCWTYNISKDYTTCLCDHMTHFGVLVDVSRTPIDEKNERILTIITYMGCGVSSCFLGITVLTYTLLEKLRRDYPSKILLNLSLALLGLNLVFLLNSWISSFGNYGLCIAVAATLHYFLLTSFTWMGLGAVNMYFALVKVFNVYVPSYILKFCLLGWGIPLIICGLVLAIKRDAYGLSDSQSTLDDSEMFCWVKNDVVFYVSVVSYIAFILLCNGSIFLVVLIQIRNMQVNQPAGTRSGILKDLRAVASLTFLLGLTWSVAFLAWGPVKVFLLYLFSIMNSLQGFFIFVFHCLVKENVRKQWRIHLCCGAFKLQEYSEWSQTATVVPKHKPNPPNTFSFMASVRSIKSNSTQSSTVSSESSQRQVTITRPDLGFVYENSLAIPRARAGLSHEVSPTTASGFEFPSRSWKNGFDN